MGTYIGRKVVGEFTDHIKKYTKFIQVQTTAAIMVALIMKMKMIICKDGAVQTLCQVRTVKSTQYTHYTKYNDDDDETR